MYRTQSARAYGATQGAHILIAQDVINDPETRRFVILDSDDLSIVKEVRGGGDDFRKAVDQAMLEIMPNDDTPLVPPSVPSVPDVPDDDEGCEPCRNGEGEEE